MTDTLSAGTSGVCLRLMTAQADIIDTPRSDVQRAWIAFSDLVEIGTLVLLTPAALLVPCRHWRPVALAVARLDAMARRRDSRQRREHLMRVGDFDEHRAWALVIEGLAGNVLIRLSALRQTLLPNWRVPVSIRGREHVDAALRQSNGVILWMADSVSAHHETYQGLRDGNLQTVHIGRPTHGMSRTRFGIRFLNPIRQRLEQRACRDFVTIDRGSTRRGVAKLTRYLNDNCIVSIRVGDQASRVIRVPFANGLLRLAYGPFRIAGTTGAPIVPMYIAGRVTGAITIHIGAPLPLKSLTNADVIAAAQAYVNWLRPFVEDDPGGWRSWPIVQSLGEASVGGLGDVAGDAG